MHFWKSLLLGDKCRENPIWREDPKNGADRSVVRVKLQEAVPNLSSSGALQDHFKFWNFKDDYVSGVLITLRTTEDQVMSNGHR